MTDYWMVHPSYLNVFLIDVARSNCWVDDCFRQHIETNNQIPQSINQSINQMLLVRGKPSDKQNLIIKLKDLISEAQDTNGQKYLCVDYGALIKKVWK